MRLFSEIRHYLIWSLLPLILIVIGNEIYTHQASVFLIAIQLLSLYSLIATYSAFSYSFQFKQKAASNAEILSKVAYIDPKQKDGNSHSEAVVKIDQALSKISNETKIFDLDKSLDELDHMELERELDQMVQERVSELNRLIEEVGKINANYLSSLERKKVLTEGVSQILNSQSAVTRKQYVFDVLLYPMKAYIGLLVNFKKNSEFDSKLRIANRH